MEYGILWILTMLTSLLLTALTAALFSSSKRKLWGHLGMLAVVGALTFLFSVFSLLTGLMYYNNLIIPSWLFPYATSFALLYFIVSVIIWRKGLVTKDNTPPVRAWRGGILAFCLFLGITMTMTTYSLIDVHRQIEFTNVNCDLITRLQKIWPSKPLPHLNAYPLYEQASNAITKQDELLIFDYIKPDRLPTNQEVVELIERNRKVIDMLHLASQRPYSFWDRPVDTFFLHLFKFPQYPEYRSLAGLLGLKAKSEALSGNPAGAFKELAVIRSMAEHVQSSPDLISIIISWAITKQEHDLTEYCLGQSHHVNGLFDFPISTAPSVLQFCDGMLTNESAVEVQFPFLMMQQRKTIEDFVQKHSEMLNSIGVSPPIVLPYLLKPFTRSIWRVFIGRSYMDNVKNKWGKIKQITESGYKHWRDFSQLKSRLDGRRESLIYQLLNSGGHLLNSPYIYRIINIDVYHHLIDIAVAASAYLDAEGSYPDMVDDLVPRFLKTVPIDPLTGNHSK